MFLALCQTKPDWSLTKSSKLVEASAQAKRCWLSQNTQCLGSIMPLTMFLHYLCNTKLHLWRILDIDWRKFWLLILVTLLRFHFFLNKGMKRELTNDIEPTLYSIIITAFEGWGVEGEEWRALAVEAVCSRRRQISTRAKVGSCPLTKMHCWNHYLIII